MRTGFPVSILAGATQFINCGPIAEGALIESCLLSWSGASNVSITAGFFPSKALVAADFVGADLIGEAVTLATVTNIEMPWWRRVDYPGYAAYRLQNLGGVAIVGGVFWKIRPPRPQ